MESESHEHSNFLSALHSRLSCTNITTTVKNHIAVANPFAITSYIGLSQQGKEHLLQHAIYANAFAVMLGIFIVTISKSDVLLGSIAGGTLISVGIINSLRTILAAAA